MGVLGRLGLGDRPTFGVGDEPSWVPAIAKRARIHVRDRGAV